MKKLWYGGTIYTMEKEQEKVESVLVENARIIAVGPFEELKGHAHELIDLKGATMYPGFVDSHIHLLYHGEKLIRLDLSKATSKQEMLELVNEESKRIPKDAWLFGEGWNENNFRDQQIPTIQELDAIRKSPIVLTRVCHHQMLVNSAALKAAGITKDIKNIQGGEIGRDRDGNLNGRLFERAMELIDAVIPRDGEEYINYLSKTLELAISDFHSKGLVGGHSDDLSYFGPYQNPLTAFNRVIGQKHHFRVTLLRHNAVFEKMVKDGVEFDEPFIEPGGMKLFTDGALGGSTAALSKPYSDNKNNKGLLIHSDMQLEEYVQLARQNNSSIAVHAIGDAAAEQVIRIIEKYPVKDGLRDRLIHACVLREDLVYRLKKLPIVVDIQPAFVPSDFPWVIERLGEERLKWAYAWKKLLNNGIMCAAGTDTPIEDVDPLKSIYAAIERKKSSEEDHEGFLPEEKITRFEAIQLYTLGSAKAICKEHERGLIKPGYVADFSIFDRDLFEGTSEELLKAKVVQTVVAGKVVFEK